MLEPRIAESLTRGSQRIIVTGAGGWLGLATLELLAEALGADFERRVVCFGSSERQLELRHGRRVSQAPLAAIRDLPQQPTWLLHFAFLTKDRAEQMTESDYRAANEAIGDTVLAALDPIGVEAVFLASSGAAYRAADPSAAAAMRLYGELKLADERRFAAWAEHSDCRLAIGRIFALTGPYINKHEAYAMASFMLDGLAERQIVVCAPRPVIRAYVAIRELMSLVFALLADRAGGIVRFDSGGEPLELAEVAAAVARALPGGKVERAAISNDDADRYHGDGAAYAALLANNAIAPVGLDRQVQETIDYLRSDQ